MFACKYKDNKLKSILHLQRLILVQDLRAWTHVVFKFMV